MRELFAIFLAIILAMFFAGCSNNKKTESKISDTTSKTLTTENNTNLVSEQKEKVVLFFQDHRQEISEIKDFFYSDKYSVKNINNDGNIVLKDKSTVWIPKISEYIKKLFDEGEKINITRMDYSNRSSIGLCFKIEFYYPENAVSMSIVFSTKDLTKSSSMYSNLENDWYLFVAGMT